MLFGTVSVLAGQAQQAAIKKADKKFEALAYVDALGIYKEVAAKGYKSDHLFKKIGDAHYNNANYKEAAKWYAQLFELAPQQSPVYNFKYGQCLKALGKYKQADIHLEYFYKSLNLSYTTSAVLLEATAKISGKYTVEKTNFNTNYYDYPGGLHDGALYVISANSKRTISPWSNEPTSDIFKVTQEKLELMPGDLNSEFNEGPLTISKNDSVMYFTRNNFVNNKIGRDRKKIVRLNLYKAVKVDGIWTNIEALPFNDDAYSFGHPALNADGTKLYFVSDMPGGKGGTDIYEVPIFSDGSFGKPINKAEFNTPANEMFPFVSATGDVYFASNGHPNLGGLDIFVAKKEESFAVIHNLGEPINSTFDDFAFVMTKQSGYFASNRNGLNDHTYAFKPDTTYKAAQKCVIKGSLTEDKTGRPLENVLLSLINDKNEIVTQQEASKHFDFNAEDCHQISFIRAEKAGYFTNNVLVNNQQEHYDISLEKRMLLLADGSDLGATWLNPIYFDFDKSDITSKAEVELQKLVVLMQQNKQVKLEVRSHTDSRANDAYNKALSEKRAQATIHYLVEQGISRDRLSGKGYGESQLLNHCSNAVKCTAAQHAKNRRSEFIIIK